MKKYVFLFFMAIIVFFTSCTITKPVTPEIHYVTNNVDLTEPIAILEDTKPNTVPAFVERPDPNCPDLEYMVFLAEVIEAYDDCLVEWQSYANKCEELLHTINESLTE